MQSEPHQFLFAPNGEHSARQNAGIQLGKRGAPHPKTTFKNTKQPSSHLCKTSCTTSLATPDSLLVSSTQYCNRGITGRPLRQANSEVEQAKTLTDQNTENHKRVLGRGMTQPHSIFISVQSEPRQSLSAPNGEQTAQDQAAIQLGKRMERDKRSSTP